MTALFGAVARDPAAPTAYARLLAAIPFLEALAPAAQERALADVVAASRERAPLVAARAQLERLRARAPAAASRADRLAELGVITAWLALGTDLDDDPVAAQATVLREGRAPRRRRAVERGGASATWRRLDAAGPPG
ncbi:MAG: hypothetical protein H6745_10490 [Deltaproteobacteria bacterium]|nr:hypothetical protein [Deltaproteobacteria bacterium]